MPRGHTTKKELWEKLKPRARQMRREPTPAEKVLWERLRNRRLNGVKFRRQYSIESYIVDFVALGEKLVIEVDGDVHEGVVRRIGWGFDLTPCPLSLQGEGVKREGELRRRGMG